MSNLTPEQVAAIINDPDLTDTEKVARLREHFIPTIDPTTCTPDRLYRVRFKATGRETIGWRGSNQDNQWCVQTIAGGMRWNKDRQLNVLGEATRTDDTDTQKVHNPDE